METAPPHSGRWDAAAVFNIFTLTNIISQSVLDEMYTRGVAMRNSLGLFAVCLALCLTSCVGETSSSIASSVPNVSSSERVPSSALSSSAKPSVQASSSTEKSSSEKQSSEKPSPSSSAAVYYTVSIYQSYYIEKEGRYGNPRFDTSVTREAGHALHKDIEERHTLFESCHPDYRGMGEIYMMNGFYFQQECEKIISYAFVVDGDLSIYYYVE